jgi:hypothetical protein
MRKQDGWRPVVGVYEAAQLLGVRTQNINMVVGLPAARQELKATRLWYEDEMVAFAKERQRRREGLRAKAA